eukprot:GHVP01070437.1.p1 GENE.GHVP01070437.1~~GHVP01070437.1.p1  ORF type:complete len:780 (-),score=147.90 GHVP01070437.1:200-2539(-)
MQTRPGNSLKQCNELVALGKSEHALELLHNTIINRRFRQQGAESASEELMTRYVELCVLFPKKDRKLRDALQAYRSATQSQSSSTSLHKILHKLRDGFELNQQNARSQNDVQLIVDSQRDLDAAESPESLTFAMLGGGDVSDAGYSSVVHLESSLAALWEGYRTILEVTKSIPKLEAFYHETATKALLFCEENQRPIEFRKLCDLLRNHRARQRPDAETLQKSEFHIETRIVQLKSATSLKLWAEAFACAEDLVSIGLEEMVEQELLGNPVKGKIPAVSLVTTFFDHLTELMWVSGNLVCHAFSTFQFAHVKMTISKPLNPRLNTYVSSLVVLAALGTPTQGMSFLASRPPLNLECQKRLGNLMWINDVPTRKELIQIIKTKNLQDLAAPCVKQLFSLVERIDVIPEEICAKSVSILSEVEKLDEMYRDLGLTMNAKRLITHIQCSILEQVVFNHLMEKHPTISLEEFCKITCPSGFLTWGDAEKLIVLMAKRSDHSIRIDYANGKIHFGRRVFEKLSNFLPQLSTNLVTKVYENRQSLGEIDFKNYETAHCVDLVAAKFRDNLSERLALQEQRDKVLKETLRQARETVREKKKEQDDLRNKKDATDEAYAKESGGDKKAAHIADLEKFMGAYKQIVAAIEESAKKLKKTHPPSIGGRKWYRLTPADFCKSTDGYIELKDVIKFLEDCKAMESEEKAAVKAAEFEVRNWEVRSRRDAEMKKIRVILDGEKTAGKDFYKNILAAIEKERRARLICEEKYFEIVSKEISELEKDWLSEKHI